MLTYVIRRVLLILPTLLGITVLVFTVMALSPGGVGASLLTRGGDLRPEERAAMEAYLNERYGLDDPMPVQYVRWLNNVSPIGFRTDANGNAAGFGFKDPNLGMSFAKNRPVTSLIAQALPITLLLNGLTVPLIFVLSIVMGVYTARFRGKALDVGIGTANLALWSVPTIWMGVLLIGLLASEEYVKIFPTSGLESLGADRWTFLPTTTEHGWQRGYLLDVMWHLVLPVICLTYSGFAFLTKLTRSAVLENMLADYARTARAKGASEHAVLWRHVFRNSLLPLITVAASILPGLLVGSVIVESIFSIDGMGRLVVEAVQMRDREVVLSVTLITALLTLVSYLIVDICYAAADPRVSYE
ncbi:MAG: ABC transporter permease [Gammaproteobacteria bacterium]|nr:ABC transporter permease [Gammaproteobacteria bacterium]